MQPKLEGHTPTYRIPGHQKFSSNSNKTKKFMVSVWHSNFGCIFLLVSNYDYPEPGRSIWALLLNSSPANVNIFSNIWKKENQCKCLPLIVLSPILLFSYWNFASISNKKEIKPFLVQSCISKIDLKLDLLTHFHKMLTYYKC